MKSAQRPELPKAVVSFTAANVLYFLLSEITGPSQSSAVLLRWGALYTPKIAEGEYWRFLTAMFLHAGIRHLVNNMLTLVVVGRMLEEVVGSIAFAVIYMAGGLVGNAAEYLLSVRRGEDVLAVGASGAVFAVVGAFLWVMIRNRKRLRGSYLKRMLLYIAMSVYFGFMSAGVANAAHLGGLISGFVLSVIFYRVKMPPDGGTDSISL